MKFIHSIYLMVTLVLTITTLGMSAQTWVVTPGGAGLKDGSSWANALDSVAFRSHLHSAVKGDTFWVAMGTYTPANNRDSSFVIPNGVKVYGGFGGFELSLNQRDYTTYTTVLSGDIGTGGNSADNCYHVVTFNKVDTSTTLDGFTVTNGNANDTATSHNDYNGGGILNNGFKGKSNPVITNCIFSNNNAYNGGAIYNMGDSGVANPIITNCTFTNNMAMSGGGAIFNSGKSGTSSPSINACIFTDNRVMVTIGSLTGGGAVLNMGEGKGHSSPVFTNCVFANNMTDSSGGAVYNDGLNGTCNAVFTNCTFADNTANLGGAIYNNNMFSGHCAPVFTNCILWNDSAYTSGSNEIYNNASTVITYSDVKGGFSGSHNQNTNPMFYNENKGDYRVLPCSPLIDSGKAAGAPAVDYLGNARPVNGGYDMGAYEYQGKSGNSLVPSVILVASPGTAVCSGIKVIAFKAQPVFGGSSPSFQWKRNGVNVGTNDSIYRDSSVTLGDKIVCVVTSNSACLSVTTGTSAADSITQASLPLVNTGKLSGKSVCSGIGRNIGGPLTLGFSYKWKPATYLSSDTVSAPFANPTTGITYTLTVTDNNTGCSNTDSITLKVNPIPTANAGGNKAICSGVPTTIGTSPTTNYVYTWFPSTGLSSTTASNPSVKITAPAKYVLIVTDSSTKCRNVDSVAFTINPVPTANAGKDDTICAGSKVTLGGSTTAGVSYKWSPSTGLNSTTTSNPSGNVYNTTTYMVTVKDSTTGCAATDTVVVLVHPFYTMGTINSHYNMYWASSYSGITYKWSISNDDSIIKGQGTDTITVIWKAGHSGSKATIKVYALVPCSDSSTLSANVGINDGKPNAAALDIYPNPSNDNITIKIGNTDGKAYTADIWDITGRRVSTVFTGFKGTTFTYRVSSLSAGMYVLKLTDEQGMSTLSRVDIIK